MSNTKRPDTERQAYDIKSFCKAYSVSRSFAYLEISAGRLKILKLGRKTLISREAAEAWLRERGQETPSASRTPSSDPSAPAIPALPRKRPVAPPAPQPLSSTPVCTARHSPKEVRPSRAHKKRNQPRSKTTQQRTQDTTQPKTPAAKLRIPWFERDIFGSDRQTDLFQQLMDDGDPRLKFYVWRVNGTELIKPPLFVGEPRPDLLDWLRDEHAGGEFGLMVRRGETLVLSGGFGVATPLRMKRQP